MKKSELNGLRKGSAIYVIAHGRRQWSRGRGFSMAYKDIRNPRLAFESALNDYALGEGEHRGIAETSDYHNVVFRYTQKAKGYCGVMFWVSFKSKEGFNKWYTPEIRVEQEIVAEGVTSEEAVEFVHQTPVECYMRAGLEESIDSMGYLHPEIFKMEMANVAFALSRR